MGFLDIGSTLPRSQDTTVERWQTVFDARPPSSPSSTQSGPQRPSGPASPDITPAPAPTVTKRDFAADVRRLWPWIPEPLVQLFAAAWEKYGDANLALEEMRSSPQYDTYFPGNRRQDGSLRHSEPEYLATIEGYRRRVQSYGIPADIFEDRWQQLIEGGTSADEFGNRLDQMFVGIISQAPQIRDYYGQNYGAADLSDAAIFASAVAGGGLSPLVIERRIRAAQIGGEAAIAGFGRAVSDVERLAEFGLDREGARRLYAEARKQLPVLGELVQRFDDDDDPLTLSDFEDAVVLSDPEELMRVSRLFGQAHSLFSPAGLYARDRDGSLVGLRQR